MAGVGKSSLYSRFPTRARLAAAALASLQRDPPPPGGDLRQDLLSQLRGLERGLGEAGGQLLGALLLQGPAAGGATAEVISSLAGPLRRRLEAAAHGGEIGPGIDPVAAAGLLAVWLLARGVMGEAVADPNPVVDLVLDGLRQGSGNGCRGTPSSRSASWSS